MKTYLYFQRLMLDYNTKLLNWPNKYHIKIICFTQVWCHKMQTRLNKCTYFTGSFCSFVKLCLCARSVLYLYCIALFYKCILYCIALFYNCILYCIALYYKCILYCIALYYNCILYCIACTVL